MSAVARIERVPLREVWAHEARDFSAWLQDNLDVLTESIGFSLESAELEQAAGSFLVDLVAETDDGATIIIENQLERSDHDHLGKLITYASAYEANAAIWIVADARPEHVQAIAWLNESIPTPMYLLKVDAVRIADSPAAPLFTLLVGPSSESRLVGESKKERSERHELRERFWGELLEIAQNRTNLHSNNTPGINTQITGASGVPGIGYQYWSNKQESGVALVLQRRDADENARMLEDLKQRTPHFESRLSGHIRWLQNEGSRRCSLQVVVSQGGYNLSDENQRLELQERMVDAMLELEGVFSPMLAELVR